MPDWLVLLFRVMHIGAGAAWSGSLFFFVFLIEPSSRALGPEAAPFMRELIGKRKVVNVILWLAGTTIVAGAILYWNGWETAGSLSAWLGTGLGMSITIGAIAAIVAFLLGFFGTRPSVNRLMALGKEAASHEGPPPPGLQQQIGALQRRLRILARTGFALVVVAVIEMAVARYA